MMKPATFAPATVRVRRMPKRISGSGWRSSHATKPDEQHERQRRRQPIVRADEPAVLAGLRDRVDERRQPAGHEHRARQVEPLDAARRGSRRAGTARARSAAMPTGTLTKKIHSQLRRVGEDPAEQDAGRGAEAADRAPGAERDVALAALGERRREDRQRGRRDDRRAEALEGAGGDQRRLRPGQAGEERGDA